ncbi:MAG TPA: PAS domain S-box protein [Candidatus Methylomirabilis sp.]|nr:PAS domain S-box protein [Candidatus Methylomirabilis sp.]
MTPDDAKTREELLAEVQALRARLERSGGAFGSGRGSEGAPCLDAQQRAFVEDQRLVWRCRPDGALTFLNDAARRFFEQEPDELIGGSSLALVAEPDRATAQAHLGALGSAKPAGVLEHRVVGASGARWLLRVDQVLLDPDGQVVEVETVARDVTEQHDTRSELRLREATLRTFFKSAAEAIVGVDRDGRIVLANPQAEAMFGHERGLLVGQRLEALIPDRARGAHTRHQADYFHEPRNRSMGLGLTLTGRRKDGSEFPIEVSLTHIPDDSGGLAMAFVTDISERMARDRQARHVEKLAALGTLAAGIAHELNNPIGVIQSRIELMLMDLEGQEKPESAADLHVLHRHARRLGRIAQGLLSFGRERQPERRPIDLNEVVEDTLVLTGKQLNRDGIHTVTILHDGLPRMVGDPTALEQVLMNLLLNARDAMPGGGTVRIESALGAAPDNIRLIVSDTGEGMTPEVLAQIAQPFFTTKSRGTGLGLSVSYTIIRDHAGTVEVQSEPDRGTTFTITFPCLSSPVVRLSQ